MIFFFFLERPVVAPCKRVACHRTHTGLEGGRSGLLPLRSSASKIRATEGWSRAQWAVTTAQLVHGLAECKTDRERRGLLPRRARRGLLPLRRSPGLDTRLGTG
jgi:hypothetical protein